LISLSQRMSGFRRNSGPNRSPANDSHPSPKITWSIWKFRILTKKLETLYCSVLSYYQLHQKLGIKTSSIYIQLRMHNFHYVSNNLIHCWPIIYHLWHTSNCNQHHLLFNIFSSSKTSAVHYSRTTNLTYLGRSTMS